MDYEVQALSKESGRSGDWVRLECPKQTKRYQASVIGHWTSPLHMLRCTVLTIIKIMPMKKQSDAAKIA